MQSIYLYLITLPVLIAFDLAWVAGVARSYYKSQLGSLLAADPVIGAIVAFYLLYGAGLVYFVIAPAVDMHSPWRALLAGAFFGLVAYGTYDLTNLATTANWPFLMTFVDIAWGAIAGALASGVAYWIATSLFAL